MPRCWQIRRATRPRRESCNGADRPRAAAWSRRPGGRRRRPHRERRPSRRPGSGAASSQREAWRRPRHGGRAESRLLAALVLHRAEIVRSFRYASGRPRRRGGALKAAGLAEKVDIAATEHAAVARTPRMPTVIFPESPKSHALVNSNWTRLRYPPPLPWRRTDGLMGVPPLRGPREVCRAIGDHRRSTKGDPCPG